MKPLEFVLRTSDFGRAAALALRAGAAVPVRFNADAAAPQTFQAAAYRGETLDIEARLLWRGTPLAVADGAEAAMCWQTNGMDDAWWTAPASVTTGGVVTATWSPSNDVGAASYRVFLRVAGPSGASYRANMLLRLLGSPGETPNALPLPVKVLDFARITYTNEPWASSSGLTTNDVLALVESSVGPTNRIVRFMDDEHTDLTLPGASITANSIQTDGEVFYASGAGAYYDKGAGTQTPESELAVMGDLSNFAIRTNLPPLSASATIGDFVDTLNAVIGALRKEDDE